MNDPNLFKNLQFERRSRTFPRRLIPIILVAIIFTILWNLVPYGSLYWLLMPLVTGLGWVATYGWRQALVDLIRFLHQLEQL